MKIMINIKVLILDLGEYEEDYVKPLPPRRCVCLSVIGAWMFYILWHFYSNENEN